MQAWCQYYSIQIIKKLLSSSERVNKNARNADVLKAKFENLSSHHHGNFLYATSSGFLSPDYVCHNSICNLVYICGI